MNNKKTLKTVATVVVAANVFASTMITAIPGTVFAAEATGNTAEKKLQSGLKATNLKAEQNLLQNTEFNGFTNWGAWIEGAGKVTLQDPSYYTNNWMAANGFPNISYRAAKLETLNGPVSTMEISTKTAADFGQTIPTVPGHVYRITYGAFPGDSPVESERALYRVVAFNGSNGFFGTQLAVSSAGTQKYQGQYGGYRTIAAGNGYTLTLDFTAVSNASSILFGAASADGSIATMSYHGVSVIDMGADTSNQVTLGSLTTESTAAKGKGKPGAEVVITSNGTPIGTGNIDGDGNYFIYIPKQPYGATVTAAATASGVTTTASQVVTQAAIALTTINAITSQQTTVSGTGEPGGTITIKNGSTTIASGVVSANGQYNFTIPKQAGNTTVTATVVKNDRTESASTVVVKLAPSTPVLDTVTNKSTKVTGTGDPGNTITIKVKDGDMTLSYTGVVDNFGEFSIPIDTPNAGATVDAIANDTSGTLSDKATKTVLDVIAPDAPTVQGLTDASTKVIGKGEANCTVTVTLPSGATLTGTSDADGNFSIMIPKQAVGKDVSVALTDAAGNKGAATVVTVQADILANPTVNRVSNQDTKITGTGVAGATVTITADGKNYTGTVDGNGNYDIPVSKLAAGLEVAVQQSKGSSTSGVVKTIVQDDRTPAAPAVNPVKDSDTKASGTGTAGDTITVKLPNGDTATGIVAPSGTWSIDIPAQVAGAKLDVTATGPNGKTSTPTTVTVAQSPTSGSLTTGDFTIGKDQYIVGTYTGDVKNFRVTIGSKVYTGGSIDPVKHTYTFYASDKAVEGPFTISALDQYGNVLDTKTANMIKVATRTPVAPTVNPVKDSDTKATGAGVAGDTITVKTPDNKTYTGTVAANGTWSVTIPAQAVGAKLDVTATTPDNKVSPATTVTVAQTPQTGTLTAKDFTVGVDKNITGTYTGDVKNFRVTIGSTVYTGGSTATDGTYSFYALDKITAATTATTYKIEALDKYGNVLNTKTANIIKNGGSGTPGTGTLSANGFVIHTDKNVTGTLTGDVKSIKLVYDASHTVVVLFPATNSASMP